jgi:phosphatidate cytidylyltransferase
VYGAVVLGAIHSGELVFLVALVVGAVLAYYELWRLFARQPYALSLPGGIALVLTFLVVHEVWAQVRLRGLDVSFQAGVFFAVVVGSVLALALMVGGAVALARRDLANGLLSSALTIVGSVYCGWMLGYLVDIASFGVIAAGPHVDPTSVEGYALQRSGLFLAILPTWANDVAAYGIGAAFGRRKLLPHVSPGKTVEGTLGGLVAGVAVAYAIVTLVDFPWWVGVAVGVIVGTTGPLGDLVESAIKRAASAKDSGGLLPGHGGMLDRLDSLIFIAPALAIFFELALRFS